ncbi:YxlC family protein [Paenibacillus gansuensis]|uniref:YxlC family protein n=1 Tax=Paenibacillus gansuensis TaxID=306542 RepID=A0ABW5PKF0_9BACL
MKSEKPGEQKQRKPADIEAEPADFDSAVIELRRGLDQLDRLASAEPPAMDWFVSLAQEQARRERSALWLELCLFWAASLALLSAFGWLALHHLEWFLGCSALIFAAGAAGGFTLYRKGKEETA